MEPGIRTLTLDEVRTVVDWAAAEGWDPGLHDAEAFHAADPEGFLGAFVDGELAGAVSAVRYGAGLGFIGLFLVPPRYRRLLLGVRLGRAALELLGARRIGTDGVAEHQEQYELLAGFHIAWRNVRHRGAVHAPADGAAPALPAAHVLVPAGSVSFEDLAAYDAAHFGARRDDFLCAWIRLPGHHAWVCVDASRPGRDPALRGFGVVRRCREGSKVGPLFAADPVVAEAILLRLAESVHGDLIVDTPEANPAAVGLARRYGMEPVFETARMYRGGDPGLPATRIFGVTSFELG